jgi:leucyl-tRNA synthetase
MDDSYIENTALNMPEIKKIIEQNKVKKVIVVKDRLINIVV